jgi:Mg-chelatase subunit ChlD
MQQGASDVVARAFKAASCVAVINFSSQGTEALDASLTTNRDRVETAITHPSITSGSTALFDAIVGAVDHAKSKGVRAVLVVLTDGQENSSRAQLQDAIREAASQDFPIVVCGYGSRDDAVLTRLAQQTSGAYFRYGVDGSIGKFFDEFAKFAEMKGQIDNGTPPQVSQ